MVPMRDGGQDDVFEVAEDGVERFAVRRGAIGQLLLEIAWSYPGKDRVSGRVGEVIGDPVGEAVRLATELLGIHVTKRTCGHDPDCRSAANQRLAARTRRDAPRLGTGQCARPRRDPRAIVRLRTSPVTRASR